jgi:diguanylate cyclase (GGDEF)-like protein
VGDPTDVQTFESLDDFGATIRIRLWRKPGSPAIPGSQLLAEFHRMLVSYWHPKLRDAKSRLHSLQVAATNRLAESATTALLLDHAIVSVFFMDLDKFRVVNNTLGEPEGDRVILEFASILDKSCRSKAVVLHRGGDEFVVLHPASNPVESLTLARNLMRAVNEFNFNVNDIEIRMSTGIRVASSQDAQTTYKELEAQAELALKPRHGDVDASRDTKRRNRASLATQKGAQPIPPRSLRAELLATTIVQALTGRSCPFASPWLNLVSTQMSLRAQSGELDLDSELGDLLKWIHPERSDGPGLDDGVLAAGAAFDTILDANPRFSTADILFAVAHGLFHAAFVSSGARPMPTAAARTSLEIRAASSGAALVLAEGDRVLASLPTPAGARSPDSIRIGYFPSFPSGGPVNPLGTKRSLLVRIGHTRGGLPDSLFADVVTVDDRPTRGGGLPDFWEATVARVIADVASNPNISNVYVLGDTAAAVQTVTRLQNAAEWQGDAGRIEYKTGMPQADIIAAAQRLQGHVKVESTEKELLEDLAAALCEERKMWPVVTSTIVGQHRRLRRELRTDGMALNISDGCRVESVAEAYPAVVEILRTRDGETVRDQAGSQLRELLDFRVHLTKPSQDRIPAFYQADRQSLNEYFQREFLSSEGLFAKSFTKTHQLEAVLNHLVKCLSSPERPSTRRAILVVPHEVQQSQDDVTPLGLVSVQVFPRPGQGRVRLHFSFAWRTVEVLVGFPYSLYGSVSYAEHVTQLIQDRLPQGQLVELAEVSYVAHSLHMFLDAYGQNIARRIVDDASV